jgi:hypothetical protein
MWQEDEEENVRSCFTPLRKREDNMEVETLDHTLWKTHFGRGYSPAVRNNYGMNE